jgi:hypothetical protein
MKRGTYLTIPQTPADLQQLWNAGQALDTITAPAWTSQTDPAHYRHIGMAAQHRAGVPAEYVTELRELRDAGIIIEPATPGHPVDHFYLRDPQLEWFNEAVWAVGIFAGPSPYELSPARGAKNPVLKREDVTDAPAAFVADPFMIRVGDLWYMFVEVMNCSNARGEIALATSRDAMTWDYQQMVLREPFHLSYPQVFEWQGQYFMIPESHQAGAVRLYRGDPFPLRWTLVTELIRGPYLADPTIFQHAQRWWMFIDASLDQASDTLMLYHADALTGPWKEHPMSPVVRQDPCTARPGGRVIHHGDRLIRYTQGCRPVYGYNVRAFEITELTATTYRERELTKQPVLGPAGSGWNACGMHQVDAHEVNGQWIACVDGWRSETLLAQNAAQSEAD